MKEIKVYTTEACSYCKDIKEMLEKENIEFTNLDSKNHQLEWQKLVRLTGLATFPTIVVGNEYYIPGRDFGSPEQIVNYLKTEEWHSQPHDDEFPLDLRLTQALKTMAFGINQGLSKIIQDLNKLNQTK